MLLRVIKKCNQNCVFCSFDGKKTDKQEPLAYLAAMQKNGPGLVQISGGEPLLCQPQQLINFCDALVKKGKTIEFQTNGTLIESLPWAYFSKLVSLISQNNGYFNINFSASDAKTDLKITGLNRGFLKRLKAIKMLKKAKAKIRFTFVINSLNYKTLKSFAILSAGIKPNLIQFSFVKGQGKASGKRSIIPLYESVSPFLIEAIEILESKKINFEIDHIPCCHLGRFWRFNVDVNKAIKGQDGPHKREKIHVKQCVGCELRKVCFGPRKDYLKIRKFKKGKISL